MYMGNSIALKVALAVNKLSRKCDTTFCVLQCVAVSCSVLRCVAM